MFTLLDSLAAWGTQAFLRVLQQELQALPVGSLPLQQGLSRSSYALPGLLDVIILTSGEDSRHYFLRIGVFYQGVIAGCHCADDPSPVEPQSEYCELALTLARSSAEATVTLVN